jgi:hypothetical protein
MVMVWNNSTTLLDCITFITTSSRKFGVLVYVVGFLDLSTKDPSSYTNLLPNRNSNGCPSIDPNLLIGTFSSSGLNFAKGVCVSTLFVCSPIAYRPPCVYCCCYCYKCCCNAKNVVDFQWCPSSFHIYPHPSVDAPHPLETLYHAFS